MCGRCTCTQPHRLAIATAAGCKRSRSPLFGRRVATLAIGWAAFTVSPFPGLQSVASTQPPIAAYPQSVAATVFSCHDVVRSGTRYEYPCLIYPGGNREAGLPRSNQSMSQQAHPVQNDQNEHAPQDLPGLAAAALPAIIGTTSALSVAQVGEETMGVGRPPKPGPIIDYDNNPMWRSFPGG